MKLPSRILNKRGMTLIEVLLSFSAIGAVSLVVLQLSSQIFSSKKHLDINQILLSYQFDQVLISKNMPGWLETYRKQSGVFKNCFPAYKTNAGNGLPEDPDTRTFACPATAALPAEIKSHIGDIGSSFHFTSLAFYNVHGTKTAGTETDPLYLNSDGTPCKSNCPISSIGYIGRENPKLDENPGQLITLISLKKNAAFKGESVPFKERTLSIYAGHEWEKINTSIAEDQTASGICTEGTVVYGIDANGKVLCRGGAGNCTPGTFVKGFDSTNGNLICEPFKAVSCGANKYMSGLGSDGTPVCNNLPSPPPAPNPPVPPAPVVLTPVSCDSWKYKRSTCSFPSAVSQISVANRRSKSKCTEGYSYGLINSTTMYVDNGCRATFNLYR